MRRPDFSDRLAEYEDDDDERQCFHYDDGHERRLFLDTPMQRGFLSAAMVAAAVLGVAALIAAT